MQGTVNYMVQAELTTKSGLKIMIEGTSHEVARMIEEVERRERRLNERRLFFERMTERHKQRIIDRNGNVHGQNNQIKLTDILIKFLEEGFFEKEKTIREVMRRLEKENIVPPSSTIHPLLARLVLKGKLKRRKGENGLWEYVRVKKGQIKGGRK